MCATNRDGTLKDAATIWISGTRTQASKRQMMSTLTMSKMRLPKGSFIFVERGACSVFLVVIVSFLPLVYHSPLPFTFWLILLVIITSAKLTTQLNRPTAVL